MNDKEKVKVLEERYPIVRDMYSKFHSMSRMNEMEFDSNHERQLMTYHAILKVLQKYNIELEEHGTMDEK